MDNTVQASYVFETKDFLFMFYSCLSQVSVRSNAEKQQRLDGTKRLETKAASSPSLKIDVSEVNGVIGLTPEEEQNKRTRGTSPNVSSDVSSMSGSQGIEIDGRVSNGQGSVDNDVETENSEIDEAESENRTVFFFLFIFILLRSVEMFECFGSCKIGALSAFVVVL